MNFIKFIQKNFPDPFYFAILLTLITVFPILTFTEKSLVDVFHIWIGRWAVDGGTTTGNGIFSLLDFSMQMCLILFGGYLISSSYSVRRIIYKFAVLPRSTVQACIILSCFSSISALVNWGLCISASSILAREIIMRNPNFPKGAIACAAYSGLMIWHGGISGSIPLDLATKGVPLTKTIFSSMNIFITLSLVFLTPIFFYFIAKISERVERTEGIIGEKNKENKDEEKYSDNIEEKISFLDLSVRLIFLITLFLTVALGFKNKGIIFLNLYSVCFIFIALSIVLHRSLRTLLSYVPEAARPCGGIILQFPFYAGIMSLISESGLGEKISYMISDFIQSFPSFREEFFGIITFLSASFLNLFIPSGGGQWKVQGTVMVQAGLNIGVPESITAMLIAYGDEFTNMVQPFWAIPLVGLTNVKAGYIISYSMIYMILSLPIYIIGILIFT